MTTAVPLHLIFVYGTLKRGHCRHFALADQRFVTAALTLPLYRMVNLGSYPAITEGGTTSVTGEVYEVTDACLTLLDEIESVADSEYHRAPIRLAPPHDALPAQAYFYCDDVSHLPDHGDAW